ncbi:MAG: anti-sigma factor [Anaerolineales bacterium]
MTNQDSPEELLPFFALGVVSEEERSQVEAWLTVHPERRAEADEMAWAAQALARLAAPVAPAETIRPALVERMRQQAGDSGRSRLASRKFSWTMPALTAASLALAVVAIAWASSLRAEVNQVHLEAAQARATLDAQAQLLADLSSPAARLVEIPGTTARPQASARLFADPEAVSAVLVVSGLSPNPAGSVYQLWLIRGDVVVGAGLFHVDAAGRATARVHSSDQVGGYEALGVSIEPEGGSEQPTGDIVLLGTITF